MTDTEKPAGTSGADQPTPQPVPAEPEAEPGTSKPSPLAPTRTSGYWASIAVGLLVLLVLLVFILENGQTARVTFFGVHGHLPQGVALLLAAVIGGLFVVLAGAARILQLRIRMQGHLHPRRRGHKGPKAEGGHKPLAPEARASDSPPSG
jgi:uncharacterized integral membrane protein